MKARNFFQLTVLGILETGPHSFEQLRRAVAAELGRATGRNELHEQLALLAGRGFVAEQRKQFTRVFSLVHRLPGA